MPASSFDFDLGLDLATHDSSPWKLQDIFARAGEEADQDFVEVTLDVRDDSVMFASVCPTSDDPESALLAEEWDRESSLRNGIRPRNSLSGKLKQLSQELVKRSSSPHVSSQLSGRFKQHSQESFKRTSATPQVCVNHSGRLKQLSRELSFGGRVKQFSHEFKEELKRLSGNLGPKNGPERSHFLNSAVYSKAKFLARSRSGTEYALQGLQFISKTTGNADTEALWKSVESRFHQLALDGLLSREDFGLCIGMKDSREFAKELFDALTRSRGQLLKAISLEELKDFWFRISNQSFDSRLQIFFDMCDKNADGRISEQEVKEVIALSASANRLAKLKDQAEEYAAMIMEELDPDNLGYIELWQLELLLRGQCGGFVKDRTSNYSQTLSQTLTAPIRRRNILQRHARAAMHFLHENWQRIWVVTLWILAMSGLFTWKFLQYRRRAAFQVMGYCLCTAKGAAETLKLNMALILLPVCRITITWLRSSLLGSILPFDDNINFHKAIAVAIVVGVFLHAGVHLSCDFPRIVQSDKPRFMQYLGSDFNFKQPSYSDIILSIEGVTGILMVILMSIAFVLATRWFRRNLVKLPWPLHRLTGFNAFWYSHHLFVLVYSLLIIHSVFLFFAQGWEQKTAWAYLAVPVALYAGERTLRALRAGNYTVNIVKAAIYPGNVLALHVTKPPGFKYQSGMYLFLQCPEISSFEWHPFSITSAPEDDCISVHIRTVGDWTLEMKRVFSEIMEPPVGGKSGLLRAEYKFGDAARFPKLRIDGPYGAPAQDFKKYDVLLLIGLGIGATPFISILKDMLHSIKLGDQQPDPNPDFTPGFESPSPRRKKKLRCPANAYFFWVTKEQGSFEWFRGIMNEVAQIDQKAVIELHNYLTSVYEEGDARSALITMVQALHHAKSGVDIVSGTRVRTHFARPNWKKVFTRVANAHKDSRIGVFYCGPQIVAKELDNLAREYNHTSHTRFEFHKENF